VFSIEHMMLLGQGEVLSGGSMSVGGGSFSSFSIQSCILVSSRDSLSLSLSLSLSVSLSLSLSLSLTLSLSLSHSLSLSLFPLCLALSPLFLL